MEDIYRETVTAIENGANFRIDFQSRSLKVNGRHMIRNGRYDGAPWLPEYGCGDFFTDVEELYRRYKPFDTIGAQPEQVPPVFHGIARK